MILKKSNNKKSKLLRLALAIVPALVLSTLVFAFVPELKNQFQEQDNSVELTILNPHSSPGAGENWKVNFITQGTADLTITPQDQATIDNLDFISLICNGVEVKPQQLPNDVIFYPDWQCSQTASVSHYVKKAGNHTLRFEFGGQAAYAYNQSWWDSDWQYRKKITITAGTAAVPNSYSASTTFNHATLVTDGKSQADGDDIRIAYWTGSSWTELDRALQEGSSWNIATTRIWFKTQAAISASASDDNYYMYYKYDAAANPPANKSNIYDFWDDFDDESLGAGWSLDAIGAPSGGATNETGTIVTISANTTGDLWNTADVAYHLARSKSGDFLAESYTIGPGGTHAGWSKYGGVHLRDTTAAGSKNRNMSEVYSSSGCTNSYRLATDGVTAEENTADRYDYNRVTRLGGTSRALYSNDGITWTEPGPSQTFTGGLPDPVRIGPILAAQTTGAAHSVDVDWFKIRLYVEPEPTTALGSEETPPPVEPETRTTGAIKGSRLQLKGYDLKIK